MSTTSGTASLRATAAHFLCRYEQEFRDKMVELGLAEAPPAESQPPLVADPDEVKGG